VEAADAATPNPTATFAIRVRNDTAACPPPAIASSLILLAVRDCSLVVKFGFGVYSAAW
jgi:hypothetical protein